MRGAPSRPLCQLFLAQRCPWSAGLRRRIMTVLLDIACFTSAHASYSLPACTFSALSRTFPFPAFTAIVAIMFYCALRATPLVSLLVSFPLHMTYRVRVSLLPWPSSPPPKFLPRRSHYPNPNFPPSSSFGPSLPISLLFSSSPVLSSPPRYPHRTIIGSPATS